MAQAALLELLPALALRRTGPQRIEPVGGACAALTGWELAAFASGAVDFAARIHPEDRTRVARALEEAGSPGATYRVEYRFEARDGTLCRVRESGRRAAGEDFHALAQDVSRERALEAQLLESQKLEATGRLADGVAHDFNNLLTVILGYSDLLAESLPEGGVQHAQAQQVVHAAQRAAELTRRLLLFTRRPPSEPRPFDLSDLLYTVDPLLRRLLGEDVELVTLPGRDLGLVEADPGQIEQVLVHLAVHARLAMPEGGTLTLETREVAGRGTDGDRSRAWVQLVVSDTGAGTDARAYGEVDGPGLASCRAIVAQAGGRLDLASAAGGGTTVTLALPRSSAARPSARLRARAAPVVGGSETILLVEDEPLVRRVASEALGQLGYQVLTARSGVEALELLASRGEPVHLLMTDLVLPQMSGGEVARRVQAVSPRTRVLFVSGYGDRSAAPTDAPRRTAFLAKPFTPGGLAAAVRAALDG